MPSFFLQNPSDGTLLLSGGRGNEPVYLQLYDLSGRKLWQRSISWTGAAFRDVIPGLLPGLYLVDIRQGEIRQREKWMIR